MAIWLQCCSELAGGVLSRERGARGKWGERGRGRAIVAIVICYVFVVVIVVVVVVVIVVVVVCCSIEIKN